MNRFSIVNLLFFEVAFRIRNFKQRQINQLIEHEEKLLRTNRHQSTMETLQEQRTFLPQHIYQIPDKSFLNHQQVRRRNCSRKIIQRYLVFNSLELVTGKIKSCTTNVSFYNGRTWISFTNIIE